MNTAENPKHIALEAITQMRETATFDDIMHEVYVLQKIERGRRDVQEGHTYSQEQMRKEIETWRK